MTDRELLEAAARAAGIIIGEWADECQAFWCGNAGTTIWNPLTDDGDALRLMSRLNIQVAYRENINGAFVIAKIPGEFFPESLDGPDECEATRRAIVRAAAAIVRSS